MREIDFAFETECECNCDLNGGDYDRTRSADTPVRAAQKKRGPNERPLVRSVAEAMELLKNAPEERKINFFTEFLSNLDNNMSLQCRCCNDAVVEGGYIEIDDD